MRSGQHLDYLLQQWPFDADGLGVRLLKGADGRDVLQLRVDLGILQLETSGRPDGLRPEGHASLLDLFCVRESQDPDFELDEESCRRNRPRVRPVLSPASGLAATKTL